MRLADNYAEACFDQGLNQRTTDDKPETEREKLEKAIRRMHTRIAELESQLSAIGTGGVEPLRKQAERRAPAAPVPQGWKLVKLELLERIQESLGSFLSDQGWSQSDMDAADTLDGFLAAVPQPPTCNQSMQPELATYSAQAKQGGV